MTHFRPALRTETYKFEYTAQCNNIKTAYYVQRMTEHYFQLTKQSIQAQLRALAPRSKPGVHVGQFQRSDVSAVPRAQTSDDRFSKLAMNGSLYL